MTDLMREYSRRQFLKVTGAASAAIGLGGVAAACSTAATPVPATAAPGTAAAATAAPATPAPPTAPPTGTFNWLTWSDHSYQAQLDIIAASNNLKSNSTLFSDNIDAFTKLKQVKGQLDMVSADALWVPHYFEEGLIEAWDINSLKVASQLYSIARTFPIWTKPQGYLGYPFGWSPALIYYDPAHVSPAPDSWDVMLDPKYRRRVILENAPVDIVAYMAKFAGFSDPYNLTDNQLATVKDLLVRLKPNVLKLAAQNGDTVSALKSGEVWIGIGYLGMDERVKAGGGPELKALTPKEGTVGWMDSEMIVKGGANENLIMPFLELAEQAEYVAANFVLNGRPLFNEKAYKLLVNQGKKDQADRYLFNKPESVLAMTLKGPGASTQGAVGIFNDVFGA